MAKGSLHLADDSAKETGAFRAQWKPQTGTEIVVEAKVRVESVAARRGPGMGPAQQGTPVGLLVSDGKHQEGLLLRPEKIATFHDRVALFDAKTEFHTYQLVIRDRDMSIAVDGKMLIRGEGAFCKDATDAEAFVTPLKTLHLTDLQQITKERPIDIAIVAVKSYDTVWARAMIAPYRSENGCVVSAQNSINEEAIASERMLDGLGGKPVENLAEGLRGVRVPGAVVMQQKSRSLLKLHPASRDARAMPLVDKLVAAVTQYGATAYGALKYVRSPGLAQMMARIIEPSAFTRLSALGVEEQRVNVVLDPKGPPQAWANLGDGYRVKAEIVTHEKADALQVPASAVFRRDSGWAVFRVDGPLARLVPVQIGLRTQRRVEVTEGLEPGARVVLHPSDRIADGVKVVVR